MTALVWSQVHAYEQALRAMIAPDAPLDDRLRAIYERLHVQALKVAILLAAMDWAEDAKKPRPVIESAHWYRAQLNTESWRASAHRLLADLGENEEVRLENRILGLMRGQAEPVNLREIYRALRTTRKPMMEALEALEADGMVIQVEGPPKQGRKSLM